MHTNPKYPLSEIIGYSWQWKPLTQLSVSIRLEFHCEAKNNSLNTQLNLSGDIDSPSAQMASCSVAQPPPESNQIFLEHSLQTVYSCRQAPHASSWLPSIQSWTVPLLLPRKNKPTKPTTQYCMLHLWSEKVKSSQSNGRFCVLHTTALWISYLFYY